MTYLYIFIGGGLGSLARYLTGKACGTLFSTVFPLGTLLSNLIACALLGLIMVTYVKTSHANWIQPLLLIGFCGGYSTFSTFGNDTYELVQGGNYFYAVLNVLISVVVGVGLIFLIRSR